MMIIKEAIISSCDTLKGFIFASGPQILRGHKVTGKQQKAIQEPVNFRKAGATEITEQAP